MIISRNAVKNLTAMLKLFLLHRLAFYANEGKLQAWPFTSLCARTWSCKLIACSVQFPSTIGRVIGFSLCCYELFSLWTGETVKLCERSVIFCVYTKNSSYTLVVDRLAKMRRITEKGRWWVKVTEARRKVSRILKITITKMAILEGCAYKSM